MGEEPGGSNTGALECWSGNIKWNTLNPSHFAFAKPLRKWSKLCAPPSRERHATTMMRSSPAERGTAQAATPGPYVAAAEGKMRCKQKKKKTSGRCKHASLNVRSRRPSHSRARTPYVATPPAYFLPLFLMPWFPEFRGPLPLAFAAISLRAFSSARRVSVLRSLCARCSLARGAGGSGSGLRTSPLLLLVGPVLVVEVLDGLLGGLQRLRLATCESRFVSEGPPIRDL